MVQSKLGIGRKSCSVQQIYTEALEIQGKDIVVILITLSTVRVCVCVENNGAIKGSY